MSLTEATGKATNDDRPLELRVAEAVGLLNLVTAELVGLIGEALRTDAWEGFGIRSPEHWVVWRCGVSPGRARRLVATARMLDPLPEGLAECVPAIPPKVHATSVLHVFTLRCAQGRLAHASCIRTLPAR